MFGPMLRKQMMEIADQLAALDPTETPAYKATVSLRDNLRNRGMEFHLASRVAPLATITIGTGAASDQELIDRMVDVSADAIMKILVALKRDFPLNYDEVLLIMAKSVKIEMEW